MCIVDIIVYNTFVCYKNKWMLQKEKSLGSDLSVGDKNREKKEAKHEICSRISMKLSVCNANDNDMQIRNQKDCKVQFLHKLTTFLPRRGFHPITVNKILLHELETMNK